MANYLVTYKNGKQCQLEPLKHGRRCSYATESEFSSVHIGWYKLTLALEDLKKNGAIVKKLK